MVQILHHGRWRLVDKFTLFSFYSRLSRDAAFQRWCYEIKLSASTLWQPAQLCLLRCPSSFSVSFFFSGFCFRGLLLTKQQQPAIVRFCFLRTADYDNYNYQPRAHWTEDDLSLFINFRVRTIYPGPILESNSGTFSLVGLLGSTP